MFQSIIYQDEGLVPPTESQTALHSHYKWEHYISLINLKNSLTHVYFLLTPRLRPPDYFKVAWIGSSSTHSLLREPLELEH